MIKWIVDSDLLALGEYILTNDGLSITLSSGSKDVYEIKRLDLMTVTVNRLEDRPEALILKLKGLQL